LDTRLTAQLADMGKGANQIDFVKMLQESNEVASKLYAKVNGDRTFDIMIPFKGDRVAHFKFQKDANDDFIKMGNIMVSTMKLATVSTGKSNVETYTGSFNTNAAPNYYANPSSVGATITKVFEGVGFDFQHRADGAGG